MSKKGNFERVGGGTYDVYRKKPKSFWDQAGEILGGIVLFVIFIGLIGAIVG